jgi:hypothetical protein
VKNRFVVWSLSSALLAVVACSSSTDFCSQTVTINYPPATDGGCQLADAGLDLTVIVPTNKTACEAGVKNCTSAEVDTLNARVACANDAGANPPACVNNQIEAWVSAMDALLGNCIATNQVSDTCQGSLNDAGH